MWQYDNRMMDILDKDEIEIRECFPTVCPVCGKKKRIYMRTDLRREKTVEENGHGVVHVVIAYM